MSNNNSTSIHNFNWDSKVQPSEEKGSGAHGAMDEDTKDEVTFYLKTAIHYSKTPSSNKNTNKSSEKSGFGKFMNKVGNVLDGKGYKNKFEK